jgi:hemerythrin-like domain-containing protein
MVNTVLPMTDLQSRAIAETRLVHNLHRHVTTLLAEAAARPTASPVALEEVRNFLLIMLRSHHESEDDLLWPLITAKAPQVAGPFAELSDEHDELDAALDALEQAPVDDSDRTTLVDAAAALRELVHTHLEHEEAILFPALREHVTEQEWLELAEKVVAETPNVAPHLTVGFFEQAGTREEADIVLAAMPATLRDGLREQARATLAQLGERVSA